jgi:DNA-3-methyladenine glycosylase II
VTSIIYQQIHGKAAASIRNKFIRLFDSPVPFPDDTLILPSSFPWFPTPELILSKSVEELRSAGLSQRKTEYICDLSTKFLSKSIVEEELDQMSDEAISKLLCSVKGIGQVRTTLCSGYVTTNFSSHNSGQWTCKLANHADRIDDLKP